MKFTAMPRYQMRKNALKKLLKNQTGRLLEIGYGAGEIFSMYKSLGLRVVGYDFSEMAYEYAMQNYADDSSVCLLQEKPEPKQQFDIVVACEVLEHIEDDMAALREWKMYMKDTGKLIISVPAHHKMWGANDVYAGHYRRYERIELEKKIKKAGMEIEKIYTYDFPACLLLDRMRDSASDKILREEHVEKGKSIRLDVYDKEEHTKKSGIERKFNPLFLFLAHPFFWKLIIKFEELFYNTDLGSAYILMARKR